MSQSYDVTKQMQNFCPDLFASGVKIEEELHREMIARCQTLALAESCTGGEVSARLVAIPGASQFLLGSIVAYTDAWKQLFLGVHAHTLRVKGPESQEVVQEMAQGLFVRTSADYVIAISGFLGPKEQTPVFFAIGKRGEKIDIGCFLAPPDRVAGIEWATQVSLFALWMKLVYNISIFQ